MISPVHNDVILKLFDQAAFGLSPVLASVQEILDCQSLSLRRSYARSSCQIACNQSLYAANELIQPVTLELDLSPDTVLLIQYDTPAKAQRALASADFHALLTHIQQAIVIARQVSEYQDDIRALEYVKQHHPLRAFIQADGTKNSGGLPAPAPYPLEKHYPEKHQPEQRQPDKQLTAANDTFDLQVSKASLVSRFKLSPTETMLAKALFQGKSLNEICAYRQVSKQTLRKQLQSILRKTATESQEELILLIFDSCLLRQLEPQ